MGEQVQERLPVPDGVAWLVDPVTVARVRRAVLADPLWLAALLDDLTAGACACGCAT